MYEYGKLFRSDGQWNFLKFSAVRHEVAVTVTWDEDILALNELSRSGWEVVSVYVFPEPDPDEETFWETYLLRKAIDPLSERSSTGAVVAGFERDPL